MNSLIYAINELKHKIPIELLQAGMMIDEPEYTANLTTLDDKILNKIIRKRVLLDANIIGGIETIIPLNNIVPTFCEYYYTVYNIPPDLVMNKTIVSALSLSFFPVNTNFGQTGGAFATNGLSPNSGFTTMGGGNAVMGVADRIGNAAASAGALSNSHIEVVSHNTLLIYAHYRTLNNLGVRVVLENDSNLNNIQPRSFKNLGMLCALAAKAYLYNKLIIPINSGYLSGGQDLGMFKNILEGYSTAEEDYGIYLREVWSPVAFQNDAQRFSRYVGSMLSPGL